MTSVPSHGLPVVTGLQNQTPLLFFSFGLAYIAYFLYIVAAYL